eukprot:Skav205456  [mRNA]  locus=scaffold4682:42498:43100:- [translate_table: standard]
MEAQLVALSKDDSTFEAAEDALEALIPAEDEHQDPEAVNHHSDEDAPASSEDEGETVFEFKDCDAMYECCSKETSSCDLDLQVGVSPSGSFKDMAAFIFLNQVGLAEIPNVQGAGVGVHLTTKCWQVRYPNPTGKQSTARSWGNLKKGKGIVPPCRALLQCLLWCWESHDKVNPGCDITKTKIQLLKGALVADVGRDIKG